MKRFVYPLAITLCLLAVVSERTPVLAKDKWISIRSKNFFLVGNANEKEVRQVARKLEQFREVFTRVFPNIRFNTPVPTTVVVFKNHDSYGPFKPGPNVAGYFQPGPDVNYITLTTEVPGANNPYVVRSGRSDEAYRVIFHEYTHLLVNNTFANAPLWFNEGLAEYYSTFIITDDQKVILGHNIGEHVHLLRANKMLPLKTLFAVDHRSPHYNESKKQGIFYAQSWALMHYLLIGKTGKVEPLAKFLDLMNARVDAEDAFQQAFGMTLEEMEKELQKYVKQDKYNELTGHFERKLELDASAEAMPLTEAEAQAYLGDLLLHTHRKDAYKYLEKAIKLDPNLGMAHASLGMAYFREGKVEEARASLERAVSLNSQNYLAHYYYAFTLSRQSEEGAPVSAYTPEIAAKIREHLQKAIALRPDFLESYNLLAFVSLVSGENMTEAIAALKDALKTSPGRNDFSFTLAQLYARTGDYKAARELLEQLVKSNDRPEMQLPIESLLAQVKRIEENDGKYEHLKQANRSNGGGPPTLATVGSETSKTTTTTTPTDVEQPAPNDPSFYLREVLRKPTGGETQLQTTLLSIECDAKGIVFVVQTESGLLKLRTSSFDDIELTTYDPKIAGDITCGERKPANVVVVCYRPNTDKKIKADGILTSIEFVPPDFKLKPPTP